jgi:hypothetical protein
VDEWRPDNQPKIYYIAVVPLQREISPRSFPSSFQHGRQDAVAKRTKNRTAVAALCG